MDRESLHAITYLKRHPAWGLLVAYWKEREEEEIRKHGRQVLYGQGITPEEVAEARGRRRGIQAVLDTPDRAEAEMLKLDEGNTL